MGSFHLVYDLLGVLVFSLFNPHFGLLCSLPILFKSISCCGFFLMAIWNPQAAVYLGGVSFLVITFHSFISHHSHFITQYVPLEEYVLHCENWPKAPPHLFCLSLPLSFTFSLLNLSLCSFSLSLSFSFIHSLSHSLSLSLSLSDLALGILRNTSGVSDRTRALLTRAL